MDEEHKRKEERGERCRRISRKRGKIAGVLYMDGEQEESMRIRRGRKTRSGERCRRRMRKEQQ